MSKGDTNIGQRAPLMKPGQRKTLLVLTAIVLAVTVIVFSVLLTVNVIRDRGALVSYSGVRLSEGVTNFLASSFKYDYMVYLKESGVHEVVDSESFWGSYTVGNTTYLDLLEAETEIYLRQIVVGAYLFDRYSRLSSSDRRALKDACAEVLDYKASGSEVAFNRLAEPMGFDYDDFCKGSELIYKAMMAQTAIFGPNGSALQDTDMQADCDKFLGEYSHVLLLMVRTEDDFVTDAEGNRVQGDDGSDERIPLSESQRAERLADLETIRGLIAAVGTDADSYMSPGAFRSWIDKYNYDPDNAVGGYYFYRGSEFTSEFSSALPTVVSRALTMGVGEFAEIELDGGVYVFLYRQEPQSGCYYSSAYSRFFEDFYGLCSDYLYVESLNALSYEVEVREGFYAKDLDLLPYNYDLYPNIK